jgi:hypothetical protein
MNYQCTFGLGRNGSYLGAVISVASKCPLVILNDEFPSFFGISRLWDPLERWAAERANVIMAYTYLNRGNRYADRVDDDRAIADYTEAIRLKAETLGEELMSHPAA